MAYAISEHMRNKINAAGTRSLAASSIASTPQKKEKKNKGGVLGGIGYTLGQLGTGIFGVAEGVYDFLVGGVADIIGQEDYTKRLLADDITGRWQQGLDDWYKPSKAMDFVGDVAGGLGQTATYVGLNLIPVAGQALSAGAMFTSAAGRGVTSAYQKTGKLGAKEWIYGFGSGTVEAGLELATGTVGKIAGSIKGVSKNVAKSAVRSGVLRSMWDAGKGEFVEESLSELIDPYLQRATIDPNAKNASLQEIIRAGMVGFVSGAVGGAGGTTIGNVGSLNRGKRITKTNNTDFTVYDKKLGERTASSGSREAVLQRAQTLLSKIDNAQNAETVAGNLLALKGSYDAYNKLANKDGIRGQMLLGEMARNIAYTELSGGVEASKADIKQHADILAQYLTDQKGQNYTAEDIKNNKDGILTDLAIADFSAKMLIDPDTALAMVKRGESGVLDMASQYEAWKGNLTAEQLQEANTALGIDLSTSTFQDFNKAMGAFNASTQQQQPSINARKAQAQPMPDSISLQDGETAIYKTESGEYVAVKRDGEGYLVAADDANGNGLGKTSKHLTEEQVNELVRGIKQGKETSATNEQESPIKAVKTKIETSALTEEGRAMVKDFDNLPASTQARIREMIATGKQFNTVSKSDMEFVANLMAVRRGVNITFADMGDNGVYTSGKNGRYIQLNGNNASEAVRSAAIHELGHDLKKSPFYKELCGLARDFVPESVKKQWEQEYRDYYAQKNWKIDEEILDEEINSRSLESVLNNKSFWSRHLNQETGSFIERARNTARRLALRFKGVYAPATRAYLKLEKMFDAVLSSPAIVDGDSVNADSYKLSLEENLKTMMPYSLEEIQSIERNSHYKVATNYLDIKKFVADIRTFTANELLFLGKINNALANRIHSRTGVEAKGKSIVLSSDDLKHIFNNHGNNKNEPLRGQIAVSESNIESVIETIISPDFIEREDKKGLTNIIFRKEIDGKITAITLLSEKKKALTLKSARITKNKQHISPTGNALALPSTSETGKSMDAVYKNSISQSVEKSSGNEKLSQKSLENGNLEKATMLTESDFEEANETHSKVKQMAEKSKGDLKYSIKFSKDISDNQLKWLDSHNSTLSAKELKKAIAQTKEMVDIMSKYELILPEDKIGKTLVSNGSYDKSVENTTICVRTLAYNQFIDAVQEKIGRPLSQMESFLVSQKLYDIATEPQCLYCYVSLDRKAYNDFLLRYIKDRDAVIEKYNNSAKTQEDKNALYLEFLNGRKDTPNMRKRWSMWMNVADNGGRFITAQDVATDERRLESSKNKDLKLQLEDITKYAQSASWAKKQQNYVAYGNDILALNERVIKDLNKHYGLRWYSFSDYSGAFIVENMQQITDAALRGLKGLAYTKDTDFAKIFAPTGMNINISVYVKKINGEYQIDAAQSANIDEAIALRKKYPNVGIVVTATDTDGVNWALNQEWSDVVIPFHIVRSGQDVANFYNWELFNDSQSDTIDNQDLWQSYLDSIGKKKASKNIYPNEHKNDFATYKRLCDERGLKPRFSQFIENPNYMKLVNETRQTDDQTSVLTPNFDMNAAKQSFDKFVDKGGYYGGWYKEGISLESEVAQVAEDVLAGKKANEVSYGRQDIDVEALAKSRKAIRKHGASDTTRLSISYAPTGKTAIAMTTKEDKRSFRDRVREANQKTRIAFIDAQAAIADEFKRLGVDSGEALIQAARSATSKAQHAIGGNIVDITEFSKSGKAPTVLSKGVAKLMQPIEKAGLEAEFFDYLFNLHNIDRLKVDKPVNGNTAEESQKAIKEAEKAHPEFIEWQKEWAQMVDALMTLRLKAGLITQELYDELKARYPHYVPTFREEGKSSGTAGDILGKYDLSVKRTIKNAKGSTDTLLRPDEMIARQTLELYRAIEQNNLLNALYDAGASKGSTSLEIVSREKMRTSLEKTATDNIADLETINEDKPNSATNTVTFFKDGEKITLRVSKNIFTGLEALHPGAMAMDEGWLLKGMRKVMNAFKSGVTNLNPFFLARNAARDIQDAIIYTKNDAGFLKAYPRAYAEMAKNGNLWQLYVAAGGMSSSVFDSHKGFVGSLSERGFAEVEGFGKRVLQRIDTANLVVEQLPRFTEFIASIEAGKSVDQAILDSADVTVNFGRSGKITKWLNSYLIPFLNASVQGASKTFRTFTGRKTIKEWSWLVGRCAILGIAPAVLSSIMYDDDEDYQNLRTEDKQNYYLLKVGDKFIKIPRGRLAALLSGVVVRTDLARKGEDDAFKGLGKSALETLTPVESASRSIFSPFADVKNNVTWYGTAIEGREFDNKAVKDRYDEGTSSIAIALGKLKLMQEAGMSPKKIHYLIDQYAGVLGDIFLPMTTKKAERTPFVSNFTVDPITNNKLSTKFYKLYDETTYASSAGDSTAALKLRHFNKVKQGISDLYKQKDEIQASKLSDKEKLARTRIIQTLINEAYKTAIDESELWTKAFADSEGLGTNYSVVEVTKSNYKKLEESKETIGSFVIAYNGKTTGKAYETEEKATKGLSSMISDFRFAEGYRLMGGTEQALAAYNTAAYEKAQKLNAAGIDYDSYYTAYMTLKQYSGDASEKREYAVSTIEALDLTKQQRLMLIYALGYSVKDGELWGLTSKAAKTNIARYIRSLKLSNEEKITLAKACGLTVKNGKIVTK